MAFSLTTLGSKAAQITVATSAITRTVPLTGTGTISTPQASSTSLAVARNRSASVDLTPFVSGLNLLGIRILASPSNGVATVDGNVLTYTPNRDYSGSDSLTYESFNATQSSGPATVTVTVEFRADPANNPAVVGLVSAQTLTVRRFSRAQTSNFQHRMRSLHRRTRTATAGGAEKMAVANSGAEPAGGGAGEDRVALAFAGSLATLLSGSTLDLAAAGGGSLPEMDDNIGVWVGGNARFGAREQTASSNRLRFTTDGLSAGIDQRLRDDLVVGLGFGYGRDETEVGFDGTIADSTAWSIAGYGSYQPITDIMAMPFTPVSIDGMLAGWSLKNTPYRASIILGLSRSSTSGSLVRRTVKVISETYVGRMASSVLTVERAASRG